jgi:hypothetical protein
MAVIAQDFYQDDEEIIEGDKKKTTGDVSGLGAAGGVGVGQGGDEKNPTGFVDLDQYVQQNQPETQEMISGLTSDIGKRAQDFTTQAGQAEQQFKERVDMGGVGFDKQLAEEFYKAPSQFTQDKDRLKKFQEMRDAQYKGPQQFSQAQDLYKPLAQQQQDILSRADLMRDRAGQQTLLSEQSRKPLTAGQMALNRALVGSTPMGEEQLAASAQQAEIAARDLDNQRKALNEIALRRQQETQQTAKSIQSGLTGARGSLRDKIADRVRAMRGEATESQREFREALARPMDKLLDEGELGALQRAGISPEQFNRLRETEGFIENPYEDVFYRDINIDPQYQSETSNMYGGKSGMELRGRVRYVDGKPVLDAIDPMYRSTVLTELKRQEDEERAMRESRPGRGRVIPGVKTFRQEVEGRDFDPSVLFRLQNPDMVYRDETVTTPEEYENLKALRELQQVQSPMDFELEDAPELYGVVPQVSGEKTLDEILSTLDDERAMYEQAAMDRFIKENPFTAKMHSRRAKQRRSGNNSWATTPAAPGQGWGGGDSGQGGSNQKQHQ